MADTAIRGYPKPVPAHNVSDDVLLLIQALDLVDLDIGSILLALSGKAPASHTHSMDQINGLLSALEAKVSVGTVTQFDNIGGVSGTAAAPDGYLLAKVAGVWVPQSPATLLGAHTHTISDITNLSTALNSKFDPASLAALQLKSSIVDADTFVGLDSATQNAPKRFSWAAIKTALRASFDAIYAPNSHGHAMAAISGLAEALQGKASLSVLPLTKGFESGQQAITSGALLAIPHGLGVKPKSVQLSLVCLTTEAGYAVGEEIALSPGPLNMADRGTVVTLEADNIGIRFGSNASVMYALNKSTGQGQALTNANWRLIVRAFA